MAKRVLIVDDASYMREMIKAILTKHGYEIVGEAEDTKEAISGYSSLKPDLVTVNIATLKKCGPEGVREILKADSDAKVLIISALGQQAMVVEAIKAGAKGFVVKPFKPEVLLDEARRILEA